MLRRSALLVAALGAALVSAGAPQFSSAAFTATTSSGAVIGAAADWTPPTVAMDAPAATLSGAVTLTASARDGAGESGVARVTLQYRPPSASAWTDLCTDTSAPYSCTWDTRSVADGEYWLRAVAVDQAGYRSESAAVPTTVTNTVTSVGLADLPVHLFGTVGLVATVTGPASGGTVVFQRSVAGASSWSNLCTGVASGTTYSCSWNTTTIDYGSFDLRAVHTDSAGKPTVSTVVAARIVENVPFRALDVSSVNRPGGTAGRMEAGDQLVLTYGGTARLSSILTDWAGGATGVTVHASSTNVITVTAPGGGAVHLGSVALQQTLVKTSAVQFTGSSMTAQVGVVDGKPRTTVTVTLGTPSIPGQLELVRTSARMEWTPSASAQSMTGKACDSTKAVESSTLGLDF